MPKFSKNSLEHLGTTHKDIQLIFNTIIKTVDCSVLCGYRSEAKQNKAFNDGVSQLKFPHSKHNRLPSIAIDAAPYFTELKGIDWEDIKAFSCFAGYVIATADQLRAQNLITHRVRWGGDWDMDGRTLDQQFNDLPHFELVKP